MTTKQKIIKIKKQYARDFDKAYATARKSLLKLFPIGSKVVDSMYACGGVGIVKDVVPGYEGEFSWIILTYPHLYNGGRTEPYSRVVSCIDNIELVK